MCDASLDTRQTHPSPARAHIELARTSQAEASTLRAQLEKTRLKLQIEERTSDSYAAALAAARNAAARGELPTCA